jgi:hypothetical protein
VEVISINIIRYLMISIITNARLSLDLDMIILYDINYGTDKLLILNNFITDRDEN